MQPSYCVFGNASTRVTPPTDDHEQGMRGTLPTISINLLFPKCHNVRRRVAQTKGA